MSGLLAWPLASDRADARPFQICLWVRPPPLHTHTPHTAPVAPPGAPPSRPSTCIASRGVFRQPVAGYGGCEAIWPVAGSWAAAGGLWGGSRQRVFPQQAPLPCDPRAPAWYFLPPALGKPKRGGEETCWERAAAGVSSPSRLKVGWAVVASSTISAVSGGALPRSKLAPAAAPALLDERPRKGSRQRRREEVGHSLHFRYLVPSSPA